VRYVTAYVKPFKLDEVVDALAALPVEALAIEEVRGYGRQKGHLELYRGTEYEITFLPKVRVEFAVPAARLEEALRAIEESARTGRIGDGKVFVREVRRAEEV
jgi:nitrogen regulatory protein PII